MKIEISKADNGWIAVINGGKTLVADSFTLLTYRLNKYIESLNQDKEVGVKVGVKKISNSK